MNHLFFLFLLPITTLCHCPHMMGMNPQPSGPSPPATFPEGDNGWDFDSSAAPGLLPEEHFIQSTYIYRTPNRKEKMFAERVVNTLKTLRENLAKSARLTLENENILCGTPEDHFRCEDFPAEGAFHYFVVEDSKKGAVVYEIEQRLNEKEGAVEMALLDALSRHSPHVLTSFASSEAEKSVGFIRALSTKEVKKLTEKPSGDVRMEKFSPLELNLLDHSLLQLRTGEGLEDIDHKLVEFESKEHFDVALDTDEFVFVLFWNNVQMVSLHAFNIWARVSNLFKTSAKLAHVACHLHPEFCNGLRDVDFYTVVAYKKGKNIGSTSNIGDEEYYEDWITLMMNGHLIELKSEQDLANAKKGSVLGKQRAAVSIVVVGDSEDVGLRHFKVASEKLFGRYFIAYYIKQGATTSVSTYRRSERQRRVDYSGRFDPASLISFVTRSSLPSLIDLSTGFTTNLLYRQRRPIVLFVGNSTVDDVKFVSRVDLGDKFIFTRIDRKETVPSEVFEGLGLANRPDPIVVVINKDRIHYIDVKSGDVSAFTKQLLATKDSESDLLLATHMAHPLRYLQKQRIDDVFGVQNTAVLPDHGLYIDDEKPRSHPPIAGAASGGCPFMNAGGSSLHEEL